MSQFDFGTIDPDLKNGTELASDLNNWRDAVMSSNSGVTAPTTTYAFMPWADTTNDILKIRNAANDAWISTFVLSTGQPILTNGSVATVKLNSDVFSTARSWSGSQRGAVTTDTDLSFDMNAGQNFSCTPTGSGTLTFTNITAGQSGFIYLSNTTNYTISKAAAVKCGASLLATISVTGSYLLNYFSPDGTSVYVTASGALS